MQAAQQDFRELVDRTLQGEEIDFGTFCQEHEALGDVLLAKDQLPASFWGKLLSRYYGGTLPLPKGEYESYSLAEKLEQLASRRPEVPRYEALEEVARGGMGAILRVRDRDLQRDLAMKVIHGNDAGSVASDVDPRILSRFFDEAQITGWLEHPGVVPIHELGIDSHGQAYFTMPLIRGSDLSEVIELVHSEDDRWNQTRALGVILKACEAMAYAHSHGIIHRDLKPANVMVGEYGETYVMDWGLAKVLDTDERPTPVASRDGDSPSTPDKTPPPPSSPGMTMAGQVLGTPYFMPPEQAEGKLDELSPRADVYSMGAILYTLLSGQMPYYDQALQETPAQLIQRIREAAPIPLEKSKAGIPGELVAITEKAMARSQQDRYRDMQELANDLRAYLENRVVRAHRTGAWIEFKKWMARNPGVAGLSAALILVLVMGLGGFLTYQERTTARILRLSDMRDLRKLREQERDLWPLTRDRATAMREWLLKATPLAERLPEHRATLSWLRSQANAMSPELLERNRRLHPQYEQLETARDELDWVNYQLDSTRELDENTRAQLGESRRNLESKISQLEQAVEERHLWSFEDRDLGWQYDALERLVTELDEFAAPEVGLISQVESRLAATEQLVAQSLESDEAERRWSQAIQSIAQSEIYAGLTLEPQLGLLPLSVDPQSGLWEFWHVQSGAEPQLNPELGVVDRWLVAPESGKSPRVNPDTRAHSRWLMRPETGIVLVLIPSTTFTMGAKQPADKTPPTAANYDAYYERLAPNEDPEARASEQPVHSVTLDPYFIGKYEVTQAQWSRIMGSNPSVYNPETKRNTAGRVPTLSHPVEYVSWTECAEATRRWGLQIPTEAQWEYAARAKTKGVRWMRPTRIWVNCNLRDREWQGATRDAKQMSDYRILWDGYKLHAPVGSYPANPFGLHEVLGNVWEHCQDWHSIPYVLHLEPGTGEHLVPPSRQQRRVHRGGSFYSPAGNVRTTHRSTDPPSSRHDHLGLRVGRSVDP